MEIKDTWILHALMENTADSIYVKDRQCRLWRVSKKMSMDLGYSDPSEIYGKTDIELFGEEYGRQTIEDDMNIMETGQSKTAFLETYTTSSGETNWTLTTKMPLRNDEGEIIGLIGITHEINEIKKAEIEYQYLATHDTLTALANRSLLMERIHQAIFFAKTNNRIFALLFIDLNGFKLINDTVGHAQGDRYLQKLAEVLTQNVRQSDTVARIGGDEFVILLNQISQVENALIIAEKFNDRICHKVDPTANTITAAIGVAIFPNHGESAEELLKAADRAMYKAKQQSLAFQLAEKKPPISPKLHKKTPR